MVFSIKTTSIYIFQRNAKFIRIPKSKIRTGNPTLISIAAERVTASGAVNKTTIQ